MRRPEWLKTILRPTLGMEEKITKEHARTRLFSAVVEDLYRACAGGDRPAADASLTELAGLIRVKPAEVRLALRPWLRLPPDEADVRRMLETGRQAMDAADLADLVF